ncbi:TPA: AAA family ATPase [Vibrio cholerae]
MSNKIKFYIDEKIPTSGNMEAYLISDQWNDFSYRTLFEMVLFDQHGNRREIGYIKIAFKGQEEYIHTKTKIKSGFLNLGEEFFSLGQDVDFYQNLANLDESVKVNVLQSLNDVVYNEKILKSAIDEKVFDISLMRFVSILSVREQFKRVITTNERLKKYHFKLDIIDEKPCSIDFKVDHKDIIPSNVHVLIGRNSVGKTYVLKNMVKSLVDKNYDGRYSFSNLMDSKSGNPIFSGVVSVSFSAFDSFDVLDKREKIRYSYVGLKKETDNGLFLKNSSELELEFSDSLWSCIALGKVERWRKSIDYLNLDVGFNSQSLIEDLCKLVDIVNEDEFKYCSKHVFGNLSSGHAIVSLTLTKLIEEVEEKTLVIIDEPECHLHPPLLSAFTRALSSLLIERNGVAIVATHSPVIVQEVPQKCVWKLNRFGKRFRFDRPSIQTFGENIGILTRDIFGLEVQNSGFNNVVKDINKSIRSESDFYSLWDQLGSEAKIMLQMLKIDK